MPDEIQEKIVVFDYLQPQYSTFGDDKQKAGIYSFQMRDFLTEVASDKLLRTDREINGERYRFQCCQKIKTATEVQSDLWEIQILRIRQKVLPGEADDKGGYDAVITLPDGTYPAESTTLLYSESKNILYFQRNIFGISIRNLQNYFTELCFKKDSPEAKNRVLFSICEKTCSKKMLTTNTKYKKLLLTAKVDAMNECDKDSSLYQILKSFHSIGSSVAKVEFSIGHKTKQRLSTNKINKLIEEASSYGGIVKLQAQMSDADDTEFSMFDFLENKLSYKVHIEYSKENPITHARLLKGLLAMYQH